MDDKVKLLIFSYLNNITILSNLPLEIFVILLQKYKRLKRINLIYNFIEKQIQREYKNFKLLRKIRRHVINPTNKATWRWDHISKHPNVNWDIISSYPTLPWDWNEISHNPNLTWEIILNNMDANWNWSILSSYIEINAVLSPNQLIHINWEPMPENVWNQLKTIPIVREILSKCPHITEELIRSLPNTLQDIYYNKNIGDLLGPVNKMPNEVKNWLTLSQIATWNLIKTYPNLTEWDWFYVSINSNITWDNILNHPDFNWNMIGISKNPNLSWKEIYEYEIIRRKYNKIYRNKYNF